MLDARLMRSSDSPRMRNIRQDSSVSEPTVISHHLAACYFRLKQRLNLSGTQSIHVSSALSLSDQFFGQTRSAGNRPSNCLGQEFCRAWAAFMPIIPPTPSRDWFALHSIQLRFSVPLRKEAG